MAITEQSRNRLRTFLEETMGEEQASAMMDHLLPVSWTDLATSQEVAQLRDQMATKLELAEVRIEMARMGGRLEAEIERLRAEMHQGFRRQTWALITATSVIDGLLLAALRFV